MLSDITPIGLDYDEARSSEERGTYHVPRLQAQGEFFLDVHPVRRLRSLLRRGTVTDTGARAKDVVETRSRRPT